MSINEMIDALENGGYTVISDNYYGATVYAIQLDGREIYWDLEDFDLLSIAQKLLAQKNATVPLSEEHCLQCAAERVVEHFARLRHTLEPEDLAVLDELKAAL